MEDLKLEAARPCRVIGGVPPAALPAVLEQFGHAAEGGLSVVLLPDLRQVDALADAVQTVSQVLAQRTDPVEVLVLPPPAERATEEDGEPTLGGDERELDRATVFSRLRDRRRETAPRPLLLLTESAALLGFAPAPDALDAASRVLHAGEAIGFEALRREIEEKLGYDAEAVCEYPGQYAVRGGLIDVYPPNASAPVRIDFFGDEIDSIRPFDPTTQRSADSLRSITLAPRAAEAEEPDGVSARLLEYFEGAVQWIWHEATEQVSADARLYQVFERMDDKRLHFGRVFARPGGHKDAFVTLGQLALLPSFAPAAVEPEEWDLATFEAHRRSAATGVGLSRSLGEQQARTEFIELLSSWAEAGEVVELAAHNAGAGERISALVKEEAPADAAFDPPLRLAPLAHGFRVGKGSLRHFDWMPAKAEGFNLVAENDLLGRPASRPRERARRLVPQRSQVDHLLDFAELVEGDHLVHLAHGVCIFRGLDRMDLRGQDEEVISVEFADAITLHLPLHESHLLTRYIGLSKSAPKLGRLGTNQWEKSRHAAEKATIDFAAEMLRVQAVRQEDEGFACGVDTDWQRMFEAAFPYTETPDQLTAIEATKADMRRTRPMDRLVCGDVGFGKTEVAIRAAFKAVMNHRQVALLVPTTVLAQQHFNTFRERMSEFPVTVEMVSRFRSAEQQKQILAQTKRGEIDILIGTHRLLSADVKFAELGLLIIDEEHRFGVRHKERLKQLRTHVDILTMSATPIPRTLHLALMGARDLSTIDTPPANRRPIETIVRGYDPALVRQAIRYELDRGGQVFYLHNRVQTIHSVAAQLEEWLPDARIGVGHGQMAEGELEDVMTRFVAGEQDVLVCTTIIENGIDIPNCNTLIIEGADRFGLAQLYQLRGRVGRFNRQAYAYLLLHRHGRVLQVARERLAAIRQYNQLGAGFKIAMRDLELRGAGNLLGPQQSGHIASVGFELYCQLLRQSVARLKGEDVASQIRASVNLDFVTLGEIDPATGHQRAERSIDAGFGAIREAEVADSRVKPIAAFLDHDYIPETRLRIDFYRRLALAESTAEVDRLGKELEDRFGPLPRPVEVLVLLTRIRSLAQECGISHVATDGNRLKCRRASKQRDDFVKIGSRFPRLTAKNPLRRLREIEQFLLRNRHKPQ